MTLLFFATWGSFVACVFLISVWTDASVFKVNEIQLFLILGLLMSFLGFPALYLQLFEYRVSMGITDPVLITTAMLSSGWSLLGAVLSYLMLGSMAQMRGGRELSGGKWGVRRINLKGSLAFFSIVFIIVCVVAVLYLSRVDSIALLEGIQGGNVAVARSDMTNNFSGKYHWYSLFFFDFSWIVSLSLFAVALTTRAKTVWACFFVCFIITTFFLSMTAQKAPLVFFLGTILLVSFQVTKREGVRRWLRIAVTLLLGMVILVAFYKLFMSVEDIRSALYSIASRGLTGQLSGAYHSLWIFPDEINHLMGRSLPNPGALLPFDHFPLTRELMDMVRPDLAERGVVGSMPSMYWSEAYSNFGWVGVIIAPIYVGAYIYFWRFVVHSVRVQPLKAAATVWVGLQLCRFAISGIAWSFLPTTLVLGVLIFKAADYCSKKEMKLPPEVEADRARGAL